MLRPTRSFIRIGLALAGVSVVQACSPQPPADVIAADGVLCDLTHRLAANDLTVACLLQPGDDPHQFRLTPQQRRQLGEAQLVLLNGYGLTPGLDRANLGPGSSVAVAELAVPNSPELTTPSALEHPPHGDGDQHEHAHQHGHRDPHVWHDPSQASAMVSLVAENLEALKPEARGRIAARAQRMRAVLVDLDRWNRRQLSTIRAARPLASGHRAFASLARAYGLKELPLVDGLSSSDSLRPQALQAVVNQLKQERVLMLFAEQLPASKALQRISALSGVPLSAKPLVADGLAPGANGAAASLMASLTANTCLIAEGLGGRCDRDAATVLERRWQAIGR